MLFRFKDEEAAMPPPAPVIKTRCIAIAASSSLILSKTSSYLPVAGLDPAIYVFFDREARLQDVGARVKPGHDEHWRDSSRT